MNLKKNTVVILSVAFQNFLLLIGFSGYGIGLSVDSANYFSVAQNVANGIGFLQFDGFQFLNAPPLYPILLAPAYYFGFNPLVYALVLQLVFFNTYQFFLFKITQKNIGESLSIFIFYLVAGWYFSFVHVFVFALSEAGFIALLMAWVYFVLNPQKHSNFYTAILLALLCLQRYSLWLVLPGILFFWFKQKKSIWFVVSQILPALALGMAWWLRNFIVSGNPIGEHQLTKKLSFVGLVENLQAIADGFWAMNPLFVSVFLYLACVVFGLALLLFFKLKHAAIVTLIVSMAIIYLVLLLVQKDLSMAQLPRYLSILWPLVLLLPFMLLQQLNPNKRLLFALFSVGILVQTMVVFYKMHTYSQMGIGGYQTKKWKEGLSPYQKDLHDLKGHKLVSNFPDMVWWASGYPCVYSPFVSEKWQPFHNRLNGSEFLVWFWDESRNGVMDSTFVSFVGTDALVKSNEVFAIYKIQTQE